MPVLMAETSDGSPSDSELLTLQQLQLRLTTQPSSNTFKTINEARHAIVRGGGRAARGDVRGADRPRFGPGAVRDARCSRQPPLGRSGYVFAGGAAHLPRIVGAGKLGDRGCQTVRMLLPRLRGPQSLEALVGTVRPQRGPEP